MRERSTAQEMCEVGGANRGRSEAHQSVRGEETLRERLGIAEDGGVTTVLVRGQRLEADDVAAFTLICD